MIRTLVLASIVLLAIAAAAAKLARNALHEPPVAQPIAFDHARHAEEELGCLDCHKTAESSPHAGLPRIAACLLCHSEAKGQHPDEPRVREYAERKAEIPWVQVNRLPGHVYFSHAMHVKLAKMECAECHGDMAKASAPPATSQIEHLSMSRCMECHEQLGATNDCLACHK